MMMKRWVAVLVLVLAATPVWADELSAPRRSSGSNGAVQCSDGAGRFKDCGLTSASSGALSVPGPFTPPNSTTLPGTCTIAQIYFDTDATAGLNMYGCTATNTWTLLGDGGGGGGYATIQDETTPLTQRTTVNFTGTGVTCVDNAGSSRTDCTITSGGGGLTHPEVMARASIGF